jgi:glycosyltransferase involved in cell wall biosynthesis
MADQPRSRLRVLLIAEACNPTWTSVPLVGYNFARALAARPDLDVTLVSHVRNRAALEDDPIASKARLCFIDNEWLARPLYRLSTLIRGGQNLSWTIDTAMAWPSYVIFEKEVGNRFGHRLQRGDFDLIHRVTPLTPTIGSPLAGRTGVPMLIGPLNGGLPWPKEYPELRRKEREWLVPLRDLYKQLPYYRSTYLHLAGVIAGSRHTATEVPRYFHGRRFYLPENGIDPDRFPIGMTWPEPKGRFRFVTVGRLVPYKGADLTVEAFRRSTALKNCEFTIIGDGPQKPLLETMIRDAGLESNVRLLGWINQKQLAQELAQSQVFVFPSLREFGGGVVLEALSSGLPSIIVDYGGPAELVTPDCGVLLPLKPREELIGQLQQTMERLAADLERCRKLGEAACQHVREQFTWSTKADRIVDMYREILNQPRRGSGV